MRCRTFILPAVIVVFSAFALTFMMGCDEGGKTPKAVPGAASAPGVRGGSQKATSGSAGSAGGSPVLDVPPGDMRRAMIDAYRLRPDARFMLGIGEIHRFMTGSMASKANAAFSDDRWHIAFEGKEVGVLPELPDFSDMLALLCCWAKVLDGEHHTGIAASGPEDGAGDEIEGALDRFTAANAAEALRRVNGLWLSGARSPALLEAAARGLTILTLQGTDRLETADILPARALAVLAITRGLTDRPCTREEALLAHVLGYSTHARAIAGTLPESDPLRCFLLKDNARLMNMAADTAGAPEARYYALMQLARLRDVEAFNSWVKTFFPNAWCSLPVIEATLDLDRFSSRTALCELMPRAVLLELAREVEILPQARDVTMQSGGYTPEQVESILSTLNVIFTAGTSTLTSHFEDGLKILDRRYNGPFLDSTTYQAYYLGHFHSALYRLGLHYLDALSSEQASESFAAVFGRSETGIAADLRQWYTTLVLSKQGKADPEALVNNLMGLERFGAPPLMRTIDEQKRYFTYGDPGLLGAVKLMMGRLDSRISHRLYFAEMCGSHLLDLRQREMIYASVVAQARDSHQDTEVWLAWLNGDSDRLRQIIESPDLDPTTRGRAVESLEALEGATPEIIKDGFQRLIKESPDDWRLRSKYAGYLEKVGDYPAGRATVTEWLERKVQTTGLERIFAQTKIASLFYKEGRYAEAWEVIKPVIESQQAGAMGSAARIINKLGYPDDAEKMALFLKDRYPDSLKNRMVLVSLNWQHGKYKEAAEVLKSAPHKLDFGQSYSVPEGSQSCEFCFNLAS